MVVMIDFRNVETREYKTATTNEKNSHYFFSTYDSRALHQRSVTPIRGKHQEQSTPQSLHSFHFCDTPSTKIYTCYIDKELFSTGVDGTDLYIPPYYYRVSNWKRLFRWLQSDEM
jgi:hypothetical protein